jgi:hypothetical protein
MKSAKQRYLEYIDQLKDADMAFDIVCARNYICGQLDCNMPVEESRLIFKKIKELLNKK